MVLLNFQVNFQMGIQQSEGFLLFRFPMFLSANMKIQKKITSFAGTYQNKDDGNKSKRDDDEENYPEVINNNHVDSVALGLPSVTLWATCNRTFPTSSECII